MKQSYVLTILSLLFFSSCGYTLRTTQIFHTESSSVKMKEGKYRYEDSLVIIDYNLWSSGGLLSFQIYNKTSSPIYINWKNSNFIFNGYNNEYWTDEVVSTTNSSAIFRTDGWQTGQTSTTVNNTNPYVVTSSTYKTVATLSGMQNVVTVVQKANPSIQIPPSSFNQIAKFSIHMPLLIPLDGQSSVSYPSKNNSPLVFRNYLAISKDKDFATQIFIDNDFWISSVKSTFDKNPQWDIPPILDVQPNDFFLINKKYVKYEPKTYPVYNTEEAPKKKDNEW